MRIAIAPSSIAPYGVFEVVAHDLVKRRRLRSMAPVDTGCGGF
jgi:hypothetical protein